MRNLIRNLSAVAISGLVIAAAAHRLNAQAGCTYTQSAWQNGHSVCTGNAGVGCLSCPK